jgi:hypothetical protein
MLLVVGDLGVTRRIDVLNHGDDAIGLREELSLLPFRSRRVWPAEEEGDAQQNK